MDTVGRIEEPRVDDLRRELECRVAAIFQSRPTRSSSSLQHACKLQVASAVEIRKRLLIGHPWPAGSSSWLLLQTKIINPSALAETRIRKSKRVQEKEKGIGDKEATPSLSLPKKKKPCDRPFKSSAGRISHLIFPAEQRRGQFSISSSVFRRPLFSSLVIRVLCASAAALSAAFSA